MDTLPQEPLACQPPPSPTSAVLGVPHPFCWRGSCWVFLEAGRRGCLLRLTQLGMRGVSHKTAFVSTHTAGEVLGGLSLAEILYAPFTGDVLNKQAHSPPGTEAAALGLWEVTNSREGGK